MKPYHRLSQRYNIFLYISIHIVISFASRAFALTTIMEALAAVGLASSIVQFVDFATKIISKGYQYQKSVDGVLDDNVELQAIADSLDQLSKGLITSKEKTSPSARRKKNLKEIALNAVAMECQSIANDLSTAVDRLKITGKRTKWKSFRQALKSQWKKEEIEATLRRLRLAREDLIVHLLVVMK